METAPSTTTETPETPAQPMPSTGTGPSAFRSFDSSAVLTVSVPADAKVYINDDATKSTGDVRHYVSRGLIPGAAYTYRVRAEFSRNGEVVNQTKSVRLTAGSSATLDFSETATEDAIASDPVETKLTLHVPADAKVILAGNEMRQTGETRHFVTSQLTPGQAWNDYVIRVEADRNGQIVSSVRTLTLTGGESREMTIDLDAPKVAAK